VGQVVKALVGNSTKVFNIHSRSIANYMHHVYDSIYL